MIRILIILFAWCCLACNEHKPASPERMAMNNIGKCHVHIEYGAPSVQGRIIWGEVVPYNKVWVTGADAATTINFSKDVSIPGKPIKAGVYAFFTIPGKDKWTVILNRQLTGKYDPKEDVARFEVLPTHSEAFVEQLTYVVAPSGQVIMKWEHIEIILPITSL